MDQCTYRMALEKSSEYLDESQVWFGHGTDNSWDESVLLLFWAATLSMDTDAAILEQIIAADTAERFQTAINLRVEQRKPAAYITKEAWFCGLPFYVNESVLVPRSPIAELINEGFEPWLKSAPRTILDLCCGSGCIGIASALAFPNAQVRVSDLSSAAMEVAHRNIATYQCGDRVTGICSDLFDVIDQQFDLILCNPPYVDIKDIESMPSEYHHEPEMGLGSGSDGLDLTRRILAQAADYLSSEGLLILEVGNSWQHLEQAYPRFPFLWLEFEHGGLGVCALTRTDLLALNSQQEI